MTAHAGTVLVVDDDPVNRAILVGSLEAQGYASGVACNGREALRALSARGLEEQHRRGYGARPVKRGEFSVWEKEQEWGDE